MKKILLLIIAVSAFVCCGTYRKNYDESWHEFEPIGNGDRAYFHTLDCKACSAHHAKMKKLEAKQNKNKK